MTQSPEEKRRRNLEAVHRFNERDRAGLTWQDTDGPAMIGEVRPLAPGAINPLYAIQDRIWSEDTGLGDIVRKGAEALKATEAPKKKERMVSIHTKGQYLVKRAEIDDEEL